MLTKKNRNFLILIVVSALSMAPLASLAPIGALVPLFWVLAVGISIHLYRRFQTFRDRSVELKRLTLQPLHVLQPGDEAAVTGTAMGAESGQSAVWSKILVEERYCTEEYELDGTTINQKRGSRPLGMRAEGEFFQLRDGDLTIRVDARGVIHPTWTDMMEETDTLPPDLHKRFLERAILEPSIFDIHAVGKHSDSEPGQNEVEKLLPKHVPAEHIRTLGYRIHHWHIRPGDFVFVQGEINTDEEGMYVVAREISHDPPMKLAHEARTTALRSAVAGALLMCLTLISCATANPIADDIRERDQELQQSVPQTVPGDPSTGDVPEQPLPTQPPSPQAPQQLPPQNQPSPENPSEPRSLDPYDQMPAEPSSP